MRRGDGKKSTTRKSGKGREMRSCKQKEVQRPPSLAARFKPANKRTQRKPASQKTVLSRCTRETKTPFSSYFFFFFVLPSGQQAVLFSCGFPHGKGGKRKRGKQVREAKLHRV